MSNAFDSEIEPATLSRLRAIEGAIGTLTEQFDLFRSARFTEHQLQPNSVGQQQLQIDSVIARHIDVEELSAISADLGTVLAGDITLDTAGFIRGGATDYDTGTGFWMGYSSGAYKFFIGDSSANKMRWDGSGLDVVGTISSRSTATVAAAINSSGNLVNDIVNARLDSSAKTMLSDFSFGASDYAGALKSGTIAWNTTTGAITGGSGVLVYRGGIVGAASGVAKFALDAATGSATFAGTLSAPTGIIGGWTVTSTEISANNVTLDSAGRIIVGTNPNFVVLNAVDPTYRLWVGGTTAATAPFKIAQDGTMEATGAIITGNITAITGAIGGFDIGGDYLRDSGNTFGLASTVTGGDDVRLWAGAAFASRGSAPFRVTEGGALVATSATISGVLTSTSGTIGGFTLSSTSISAGSGDNYVELASDVSGKPNNSALILGVTGSYHYYTLLGRGKLSMTFEAAISDNYPGMKLGVFDDGTAGSLGYGYLELARNTDSAYRVLLDGDAGSGTFLGDLTASGTVRANSAFNLNGTNGITDTIVVNVGTNINVVGGIITGWS